MSGHTLAPLHRWSPLSSILYHWHMLVSIGRDDAPVPPVEKQMGAKSANLTLLRSVKVLFTQDSLLMMEFKFASVAAVGCELTSTREKMED